MRWSELLHTSSTRPASTQLSIATTGKNRERASRKVRVVQGHTSVRGHDLPSPRAPQAQPIEIEIDHRRRVERQHLADQQPADDRDTERPTKLVALARAHDER